MLILQVFIQFNIFILSLIRISTPHRESYDLMDPNLITSTNLVWLGSSKWNEEVTIEY